MSDQELLGRLSSSAQGLSAGEAARRLAAHGPNALPAGSGPGPLVVFMRQFQSPLVLVLLLAAGLSFYLGKAYDPYVILGIVLVNGVIGFFQEHQAARALEALARMSAPQATVLRDGEPRRVDAREIVPGDVLALEAGDRVAADARLLSASELNADESALTGESMPAAKSSAGGGPAAAPLSERRNMVFMNTTITHGRGRAIVVETGGACEMGRIAAAVAAIETTTPLQRRMDRFGRMLGAVVVALVVIVALVGMARGIAAADVVMLALAMAVSGVPEGLPIVITVVLAIGVSRMAKRQALIRQLPAVEALGGATVICTDKTGTLTHNALTVTRAFAAGHRFFVTGEGYGPVGGVFGDGGQAVDVSAPLWRQLAACARLCNDATVAHAEGQWRVAGDPTEGALVAFAEKASFRDEWERLDEIPFSSERRWMGTLNRSPAGEAQGFVKGAPDRLFTMADAYMDADGTVKPLDPATLQGFEQAAAQMAGEALRVLALAWSPPEAVRQGAWRGAGGLVLLGLVGLTDPPRQEAAEAIARCGQAGIRVVMVTGDHTATARAIAGRLGLLRDGSPDRVVDGRALAAMDEVTLAARIADVDVFARVDPLDKLRIVRALQARGEVVAMTGDGVNDAPALRAADIGVGMGVGGTEVAKEAADMVLADDNFATIVAAVEEGRVIAANLKKVVQYLISTSFAEIALILAALTAALPVPLVASQILWINLVCDGLFDKTLALERGEPGLMERRPYARGMGIIDREMVVRLVPLVATMTLGTLAIYAWDLARGETLIHAQTMAFTTLVAFQWFSAFANRSFERRLLGPGILDNRWMLVALAVGVALQLAVVYWPPAQAVFHTVALGAPELGLTVLVASSLLIVTEAAKVFVRPWLVRVQLLAEA